MRKINTKPPSGTRDFLPREVKQRERIFNALKVIFESFGYAPIETPAFERLETLMGKYGEEEKLIFKILKRGQRLDKDDADLALRYDFTVSLARFVAEYRSKLPRIFRRYQIGPVWRADRPSKGRFREFYQCDLDIVGTSSLMADAEIILVASEAISSIGLFDLTVRLNSRKILDGLSEIYDISEKSKKDFLISLDKFNKIGIKGVKKELQDRGISSKTAELVASDLMVEENTLKEKIKKSKVGQAGLDEVETIKELLEPLLKSGKVEFSPFLARGLDYYTGPIFEIYSNNFKSAIAAGGRYDNLIGLFSKEEIPACGISLGIERILMLAQKTIQEEEDFRSQVFVTVWNSDFQKESMEIAQGIRNKGIRTETYLGKGNISRQLRFASDSSIRYCVIFGPDERISQEFLIKDLETGEQKKVSKDQLVSTVEKLIARR